MTLVYGALVVFLVTIIVTESYLFRPVRHLAHQISPHLGVLFSCNLCFGTWVGLAVGWFLAGPMPWWADGLAFQGLAHIVWMLSGLVDDIRTHLQR